MKMIIRILDNKTGTYVENEGEFLMRQVGLDPRMGFEEIALQADGTPIVCDRCGNFGYLDTKRFSVKMCSDR